MIQFNPLKKRNQNTLYKEGDVFVLFGELFGRGYANGLVEEAQKHRMRIFGVTVGRRNAERELHPLNDEQLAAAETLLNGRIFNIPMEAGFDMETPPDGLSPVDMLKDVKLDNWREFQPNMAHIEAAVAQGRKRFETNLSKVVDLLRKEIKPGNNVHFAHIMAGGVPRAKIILALANRVFKTVGERWIQSGAFWNSGVGEVISRSFNEVTAESFRMLLDGTDSIRESVEKNGGKVFYTAYGYHGTEIFFDNAYRWQTYTPYQQGHAKKQLENYALAARQKGIAATVYNCPEIRTNSSDIFIGVELSLFPFINALKQSADRSVYEQHLAKCNALLNGDTQFPQITETIEQYLGTDLMRSFRSFEQWPMETSHTLSELMINTSNRIVDMHKNPKELVSDYLSKHILVPVGKIIFHDCTETEDAAVWIGHDIIAQSISQTG